MEAICEQIRQGNTDRDFYKNQLVKFNNLARKEWIQMENPLYVAVVYNQIQLVDLFIYLGIQVNSVQKDSENCTKVSFLFEMDLK